MSNFDRVHYKYKFDCGQVLNLFSSQILMADNVLEYSVKEMNQHAKIATEEMFKIFLEKINMLKMVRM